MSIEGFQLLTDVTERRTEWLWHHRLALGELAVVEGNPATNKSSLLCDVAARLTRGAAMPGISLPGRPRQGGALFMIGEDSINKTVVKRLRAAGADLARVAVLERAVIPGDLGRVEKAIRASDANLLVVDSLNDFLDCNVLGNQSVRRALRPLHEVAERTHTAVVLLRHFTKSKGGRSLLRGGGSIAITGMARSQLKVYNHPTDSHMRVLMQDKNNLGPLAPSLQFEIVPVDGDQFRLEWRGECQFTIAELDQDQGSRPKLDAAEKFLLEKLADGPKEVGWLVEQAAGICSKRTLDEAKSSLELVTKRKGKGRDHRVHWAMRAK